MRDVPEDEVQERGSAAPRRLGLKTAQRQGGRKASERFARSETQGDCARDHLCTVAECQQGIAQGVCFDARRGHPSADLGGKVARPRDDLVGHGCEEGLFIWEV
ncbi:hypothetical protein DC31_01720 [Microbacterium sp. CH12i]|nr:hypothetical protein DC31_01720 [Microbacterium sp. CH12i]